MFPILSQFSLVVKVLVVTMGVFLLFCLGCQKRALTFKHANQHNKLMFLAKNKSSTLILIWTDISRLPFLSFWGKCNACWNWIMKYQLVHYLCFYSQMMAITLFVPYNCTNICVNVFTSVHVLTTYSENSSVITVLTVMIYRSSVLTDIGVDLLYCPVTKRVL